MQKIIALVIVLFGVGGGLALGLALRPGDAAHGPDDAAAAAHSAKAAGGHGATESDNAGHGGEGGSDTGHDGEALSDRDYIKIGRQIIVPIVKGGKTEALMLFDLALDVPRSLTDRTHAAKPRLRDAFLRELFEMSYTGAFSSTYTDERVIEELREKLRAAARRLLGAEVADVLILDIMRQEL